jgi:hypothetical protein
VRLLDLPNIWRLFVLGTAVVALAHCGEGGTPATDLPQPGATSTSPSLVPPTGSIYLGAYVNPSQTPDPPMSLVEGVEQQIGRRFALSLHYYGFYQNFPGPDEINDAAYGRIPVESWDCTPSNAAIAAGNADQAIRTRAVALKAYGHPVFLRYMYEMELASTTRWRPECYDPATDLPNGVFSPQNFIAAWDHIRKIFAEEGVTNVVWLWNPAGNRNLGQYYPGDAEVDWTGMDRYDTGNVSDEDTFADAYQLLAGIGKPIMIGETGAQTSYQNIFYSTLPSTLQADFPLVKGVDFFDSSRKDNYFAGYSWVIAPSSLSAFTTMANSQYFSAYQQ